MIPGLLTSWSSINHAGQVPSCEVGREREREREKLGYFNLTLCRLMQLHIKSGNSSSYPALLLSVCWSISSPGDTIFISQPHAQPITTDSPGREKIFWFWEFSTRLWGVGYREVNCFALIWQFTFDRSPRQQLGNQQSLGTTEDCSLVIVERGISKLTIISIWKGFSLQSGWGAGRGYVELKYFYHF